MFKIGARVRRTKDEHMGMSPGDEATIASFSGGHYKLREYDGGHAPHKLELVRGSENKTILDLLEVLDG